MKIIKRQFDITPFIDERVLKYLKEKNMLDFYIINLLNFIEKYKNAGHMTICFPFIIDSFAWAETPEGSNYWVEAHVEIDNKSGRVKRLYLKDVVKEIGYENSQKI